MFFGTKLGHHAVNIIHETGSCHFDMTHFFHIYFLVHSLFGQNKLHGGSEYPLFAAQFVSDILSSMFFRDHQFDQLTRKRCNPSLA
jgi:hypothetical protein